jgi:hypothetical protein
MRYWRAKMSTAQLGAFVALLFTDCFLQVFGESRSASRKGRQAATEPAGYPFMGVTTPAHGR